MLRWELGVLRDSATSPGFDPDGAMGYGNEFDEFSNGAYIVDYEK